MAKNVIRTKGKVHEIEHETKQERLDRHWLAKYEMYIEFIKKFGHQKFPSEHELDEYGFEYKPLKNWANSQRAHSKSGKLEDWQYSMLAKAGFDFSPKESRWNRMYDELLEFKRINGHCNVSRYDEGFKQLCYWVSKQRLTRESISVIKIKKLDEIGFDWGVKQNEWDEMYGRLREYYIQYGTSVIKIDLTKNNMEDKNYWLHKWANKQIENYRTGYLSLDKTRMLKKLNFDFEPNKTNHKNQWDTQFLKLVPYKKKFGDYNVPLEWEEDPYFGQWVARQIKEKNYLDRWKKEKLYEIGFFQEINDPIWDRNYKVLKQFYEINGHLKISSTKNTKLYTCVNYIRGIIRGYKNQSLSNSQIRQLEEIGFECEPSIEYWYKMFRLLVEFKNQNGHCNVELNINTEILYKWCESNRKNKSNLSENQIQKLNKIGFVWERDE